VIRASGNRNLCVHVWPNMVIFGVLFFVESVFKANQSKLTDNIKDDVSKTSLLSSLKLSRFYQCN